MTHGRLTTTIPPLDKNMPINQAVNAIFEEFDLPDEVEISTLKKLITGINNNVLPLIIKEFLRLRWAVIKNTHLAYPLSPNHPVNIFCIRLAEVIAEDNEAIIQLLIPTLLERDYVAGSLEALTETEIDGKRCLIPDQAYFLLENNTTLLPLIDWFEYISDPSVPCYFHLYTNNSRQVPLSDQEVSLLRHSCGDLSTTLFKQLEYYRELALSSSSLYGAIKMLTRGLMEGGVGNESNPDLKPLRNRIAGPAATEAAEKFLSLWASIPDSAEKQAISALRVANYTAAYAREFPSRDQFEKYHPSLSDYILLLRYSQGHPLTDEEETHQQAQDLINCVEEISLGLNNIVNAHQAALENFSYGTFSSGSGFAVLCSK